MNTDIHIPFLNDAVDFVKVSEGNGSEGNPCYEDGRSRAGDLAEALAYRRTCSTGLLDRSGSQRISDGTCRRKSRMKYLMRRI